MSDIQIAAPAAQTTVLGRVRTVVTEMVSRPSGMVGLGLVVAQVLVAVLAPLFVPYDYKEVSAALMLNPPSIEHWFGTDHLGRDVFTRTLLGGREVLLVTSIATVLAVTWGGLLGILFGLIGGRLDDVVMRVVDAFLALPWILVMLLAVVILGSRSEVLIPTLGFFYGIPVIRVARAATHDVVARDFVTAARARGERRMTVVRRELLPNVLDVLLVEGAMRWSWMLLAFSSLSFLGFGVAPPTPDWGLMISDARGFMSFAPWAAVAPVVALSSLIIGINLSADTLAKAMGIDRAQQAPL